MSGTFSPNGLGTPGLPGTINPITGQMILPQATNSMAPALPGALAGQAGSPQASQAAAQALTGSAHTGISAQLATPQQAPGAAPQGLQQPAPAPVPASGAPQGAPPSGQPAAPKLPATPFTPYAANIAHYESGGGAMAGNGGGAFQLEPETTAGFEKANPQFAGQDKNAPAYQGAAYSWLTTQNAAEAQKAGVDATAPGVNYAAFALGAPTAIAMAQAKDPTVDAAAFVSKLPNGPQTIKGNPALFANGATIDDVFQRAQSVQTTGALPNAAQQSAQSAQASSTQPGTSNTPAPSSDLAGLLSKLPDAPQLKPAQSNPYLAFASGMLGSHNLAQGLGAGFAGINAAREGRQQSTNDTAIAQQNSALQTAQSKIELGKLAAFQPVLGADTVTPGQNGQPDQVTRMWRNGLGEVQYKNVDGTPIRMAMQGNAISAANGRATQRLTNQDNLASAGTNAGGAANPVAPPPNAGPSPMASPVIPGTSIPSQQAVPQGPPPGAGGPPPGQPQGVPQGPPVPQQARPQQLPTAQPNADPVAAAAGPLVQALDAQAATYRGPVPSIAKAYVTANQTAYTATQKAAVDATDANVAATKALQAVQADPGAFPQSSAWGNFNNMITSKLGWSPFSGASNGQLQLSQAFIKQANAGGMGDLLHNAMGISRPSQMEVQMVQHAVANGTMPLTTLTTLMQSGINNNNSAIAEGQIAQKVWNNGKYAAMPGSFTTAMTTAQSNLENGKYPALYTPQVQLPPTNAPAGGGPDVAPAMPTISSAAAYAQLPTGAQYLYNGQVMTKSPQQSPAAPVALLAGDTKGYAALPSGAQYTVNGTTFTKQ